MEDVRMSLVPQALRSRLAGRKALARRPMRAAGWRLPTGLRPWRRAERDTDETARFTVLEPICYHA